MDLSAFASSFIEKSRSSVLTVDSHTAGEPTRLIVGGVGPVPGETMEDKRRYCMEHLDGVRLRLTREPRGHRDMFAALVTEPVSEEAAFGLVYMDARRYPFLCGHATMGAVTTLVEMGAISLSGPEATVVVDTPSGPMTTRVGIGDGKVLSAAIRTVPSFVYGFNEKLQVPGLGEILVDSVCVGGFFAMVSAGQIGMKLAPENSSALIELGMRIIDEANRQLTVRHPLRPEVATVDVTEFYDSGDGSIGAVVYGERHMDRSPCGTGTTAKVTLLHHKGLIGAGESVTSSGPLGTTFEARIVEEATVGDLKAVVVEIEGRAHITGVHRFLLDPDDPFPEGFLL